MSAVLLLKRNDKQTAIGEECFGVKHGDPVDIIDDTNPVWGGKSVEEIISGDGNHEAFLPVAITDKQVKFIKPLLKPTHNLSNKNINKNTFRPRIKRLDISALAQLSAIADLDNRMHTGEKIGIINGTGLTEEHFLDATLLDNAVRYADIKAISIGAASVGIGGTYATLVLAYGDLANLTGDLTFTTISAFVSAALAAGNENLGGFNFLVTSNIDPLADPTRDGNLITINHNGGLCFNSFTGNGTFIIEKLFTFDAVAQSSPTTGAIYSRMNAAGITATYRRNMMNFGSVVSCGIRSDGGGSPLHIHDNTMYNGKALGTFCLIIDPGDGNVNSIYSNNNICSPGTGIALSNNGGTLRNNIVDGGDACYNTIGGTTGRNNFGSDATGADGNFLAGSGNEINQVVANGWQSLVNTNANYLDITNGGIFDSAGVANDAAIARILCGRGRQVPGPNGTSVGVAERITPTPSAQVNQPHIAISNSISIM